MVMRENSGSDSEGTSRHDKFKGERVLQNHAEETHSRVSFVAVEEKVRRRESRRDRRRRDDDDRSYYSRREYERREERSWEEHKLCKRVENDRFSKKRSHSFSDEDDQHYRRKRYWDEDHQKLSDNEDEDLEVVRLGEKKRDRKERGHKSESRRKSERSSHSERKKKRRKHHRREKRSETKEQIEMKKKKKSKGDSIELEEDLIAVDTDEGCSSQEEDSVKDNNEISKHDEEATEEKIEAAKESEEEEGNPEDVEEQVKTGEDVNVKLKKHEQQVNKDETYEKEKNCVEEKKEIGTTKGDKGKEQKEDKGDGKLEQKEELQGLKQEYGPALPPKRQIGPDKNPDAEMECYGPALPPGLATRDSEEEVMSTDGGDEEEEGEVVGPSVPGQEDDTAAQRALEVRAVALRKQLENKEEISANGRSNEGREAWMTELPPEDKGGSGIRDILAPRKFRTRDPAPRDESWAHPPGFQPTQEKDEKAAEERHERPDKCGTEAKVKDEGLKKKKKPKSLLEQHQKALKKKKKKERKELEEKPERRPFDRDIDLGGVNMTSQQKRSVIEKAQLLDSRFSCGESKYL